MTAKQKIDTNIKKRNEEHDAEYSRDGDVSRLARQISKLLTKTDVNPHRPNIVFTGIRQEKDRTNFGIP